MSVLHSVSLLSSNHMEIAPPSGGCGQAKFCHLGLCSHLHNRASVADIVSFDVKKKA